MRRLPMQTLAMQAGLLAMASLWPGLARPQAFADAKALAPMPSRCVAVVGEADLHGAFEPSVVAGPSPESHAGELRYGGLGAVAAYVAILRQHYGDKLLLLSGGDTFQGSLASNQSRGSAVVDIYNAIGVTATAVGNHDFDYGSAPDDPRPQAVLRARMAQARYPFLALNVFDKSTHRPIDWPGSAPSLLVKAGDIKVGVIGISGTDTPQVTSAVHIAGLEFPDPVPLIVAEARALRVRGAALVVLLAHAGGHCRRSDDRFDRKACSDDGELLPILDALPEGTVDAALGGHTHQYVNHWINKTMTVQAGALGQHLAWVELCAKPQGGVDPQRSRFLGPLRLCLDTRSDGTCKRRKKSDTQGDGGVRPAQFLGRPVEVPAPIAAMLRDRLAEAQASVERTINAVLPAPLGRSGDAGLGDLVAEAMRQQGKADFGMQNLGGVRADLPAGPVKYGDVYQALPFENRVAVLQLKGREVALFFQQLILRRSAPPFMAGLGAVKKGEQWELRLANGSPLSPEKTYRLATSDFLANGGDGLKELMATIPADRQNTLALTVRDALVALLEARFGETARLAP